MKRNPDFLLREVAGKQVAVPVGKAAAKFHGMLTLNASSVYLWQLLEQDQTVESLTEALCEKYAVERETAQADVLALLEKLLAVGAVTE